MPFANVVHRVATHLPLANRDLLMIAVTSEKAESHTLIVRLRSRCRDDMEVIASSVSKKDATRFWPARLMLAIASDQIDDWRLDQYLAKINDGALPNHR